MKMFKLMLALGALVGCTEVGPGEAGIEVRFGEIKGGVLAPGVYASVFSDVVRMSTRTQTYTMAGPAGAAGERGSNARVDVLARDQLPVSLDVSVMFHLEGSRAIQVYRVFGTNYDDTIVHPLVRTAVRDAASEFAAVDLIDRRADLQLRMATLVRGQLAATLQGRGVPQNAISIDNILIRNIDLPQSISDAIANVQRQRQATVAAEQINLTARAEANTALTRAQGEAAALLARTRADAEMLAVRSAAQAQANRVLSASLTPEFLQYERIQATRAVLASNGTRTVFLPGGAAPNLLMGPQ